MEKEFYIGQPLIIKDTGEKVTFLHVWDSGMGCTVLAKGLSRNYVCYYEREELEPSTEFTFSEITAGLQQGYFEVGTEFRMENTDKTIRVVKGNNGLYLKRFKELLFVDSKDINSTWQLIEPRKEMTLEEIEAELGYKINLT